MFRTCLLAILGFAVASQALSDDSIAMKNNTKLSGEVSKCSKGQLTLRVPNGYVGGFPTSADTNAPMSNVRAIVFDGANDYFSVVLKNGEVSDVQFTGFSQGEFSVAGGKPIRLATVKEFRQAKPAESRETAQLSLLDLALGQAGRFKHPLLVGFVFEKGFVGQLNYRSPSSGNYEQKMVVIRGVDASGLTSGSWARLNQDFKVSRTERLTNGDTVLVAEPVDPSKTNVSPAEPMGNADSTWTRVRPENP